MSPNTCGFSLISLVFRDLNRIVLLEKIAKKAHGTYLSDKTEVAKVACQEIEKYIRILNETK